MKNCQQIQDILLTDYIDGMLSAADRAGVNAHLASCADCRAVLRAAEATHSLLNEAPPLSPPAHLWNAIRASVEDRPAQAPWSFWLDFFFGAPQRSALTALATVVILAGVTIPALLSTNAPRPSNTSTALIALIDERERITAIDDMNLNTTAEFFLNYKGENT